jgi:hypothetical protein
MLEMPGASCVEEVELSIYLWTTKLREKMNKSELKVKVAI